MREAKRIYHLLKERGLLYYMVRPRYFLTYVRYLAQIVSNRWPKKNMSMYVLEMPISRQDVDPRIPVHCFSTVEPLLEFARRRELEEENWSGKYIKELERRFARGDKCFAAEEQGSIAAVLFRSGGPCPVSEINYEFVLPHKTLGLYDVYTLLPHRGRNLYSVVFRGCMNTCMSEGYNAVWMWIAPNNLISLKVHEHLGFQKIMFEVSMYQRWGIRRHEIHPLNRNIKDLPEMNSLKLSRT
jgi:hypothetical protein